MSKSELEHFCTTIKHLRAEHHLTKTDMAKILGISVCSLNKLERGVMPRISCEVVYRMMDYFHLTAKEVFGDDA